MLEAVPAIVAEAVAVGAAAGLSDTAEQAIADAYQQFKAVVTGRYTGVDVAAVEQRPSSQHRRQELAEDLTAAGAERDTELLAAARALLAVVRAHEAQAGAAAGVDLERVEATALRIAEVSSTGTGVRVVDGSFAGDIEIGRVRTGRQDPPDPPSARR
ncbi:hypothetical protein ACLMAJ_19885 [Nocardia sp. KC 131]|uniref:hypothetical protein n=1 Tax=Nocardia arseniciresistens TaxID=3392119 RepID=UPI00398EB281